MLTPPFAKHTVAFTTNSMLYIIIPPLTKTKWITDVDETQSHRCLTARAKASLILSIPNYLPSRQGKSLDYELGNTCHTIFTERCMQVGKMADRSIPSGPTPTANNSAQAAFQVPPKNGPIFASSRMSGTIEKLPLSGAGKHPVFQVTLCHQNVSTNVNFANIESE